MGLPPTNVGRNTPYVTLDPAIAVRAYQHIRHALPGIGIHYAVKCQPDPTLCAALAAAGADFEVASADEVAMLARIGVPTAGLVCSNPVKSITDIRAQAAAGVTTYAFDSLEEIAKLAVAAPGADVIVRLATRPAGSSVPSEGKFGVGLDTAAELMLAARAAGLQPAGIGFHVGSQCLDLAAWPQAIDDAATVMRTLEEHRIRIRMLDIGGGFPATYAGPRPPDIEAYGEVIGRALADRLPYPVPRVIAEPGRAIAAAAGTMIATVIGTAQRPGPDGSTRLWGHLDTGAFHGMVEALETGCGIAWPVTDSRRDTARHTWTLTGPSCDSQDTIVHGVDLSAGLRAGDRVMIGQAGAYTTAYSSGRFNGFSGPALVIVGSDGEGGDRHDDDRANNGSARQASPAA